MWFQALIEPVLSTATLGYEHHEQHADEQAHSPHPITMSVLLRMSGGAQLRRGVFHATLGAVSLHVCDLGPSFHRIALIPLPGTPSSANAASAAVCTESRCLTQRLLVAESGRTPYRSALVPQDISDRIRPNVSAAYWYNCV